MPRVRVTGVKSTQGRQEHGGHEPAQEASPEHRMHGGDLVPHGSGGPTPVVPDPRCTCCDTYARSVPHPGLVPAALPSVRSGRDVAGRPPRLTGASRHVVPDLVAQAIAHGLAELVVGEDADAREPGAAIDRNDGIDWQHIAHAYLQHLHAVRLGEYVGYDRHLLVVRGEWVPRAVVLKEVGEQAQ